MKLISNIKKQFKRFMTGKSGFSLVELIVVIAIMAVMAAVLAPALLGYVERSRAQKDDSAMDEVVASVQLALADQNVYDEVLEHSVYDNVSCYIDTASESDHTGHRVSLKAAHGEYKEQYMFGDEARLLDETVYYAAGNMRGMTVTFSPSDSGDTYDLKNGVINKFVGRKTGYLYENPELYNRVRSTIGDTLETTSQTYRNSDYTLFIRVGSTGGAEAQAQDAISVWGQYNGTNLAEKDHSYVLATGRVVGAAGANDATTNEQQQNQDDNVIFGENYVAPPSQLTNVTPKTWNGFTDLYYTSIWTDGTNIYHSRYSSQKNAYQHYVLNGDTWKPKTWKGVTYFTSDKIWTDGTNTYYSDYSRQYILNGDTWEPKTWKGFTTFYGRYIWTDGANIYYSYNDKQYVLNGDTWELKTWNGLTNFRGSEVWTDGTNTYYSNSSRNYVLNGDTWEPKTWNGVTDFTGAYVWTDGTNNYYSNGNSLQYVFS